MKSQPIGIGILGFGTVGCGTIYTLQENQRSIALKVGRPLEIKLVADTDWKRSRPYPVKLTTAQKTTTPKKVLEDPDIQIVVECIGGVKPARDYVLQALRNGKNVVTSNKELIAKHGREILQAAERNGVDISFEAAVAGGIPIIKALKESLAGNRINRIMGIVNGTTNYILTKMSQEGSDFSSALKQAQEHRYAEADPTADVEGYDACYKLAILSSIAFESRISFTDVYREGITNLQTADIVYARDLGYVIKLLAIGEDLDDGIQVRVHPVFLTKSHPLTAVNDVFNAIWVQGSSVGEVMFYGRGAGSLPTGSAMVGDIIDIARNIKHSATGRLPCTCFNKRVIRSISELETKYYIRMLVADKPGVLGKMATVFGVEGVSIASVLQTGLAGKEAEIVWITHRVKEQKLQNALSKLKKLAVVENICCCMRVED